jgi:hypothetical protein
MAEMEQQQQQAGLAGPPGCWQRGLDIGKSGEELIIIIMLPNQAIASISGEELC